MHVLRKGRKKGKRKEKFMEIQSRRKRVQGYKKEEKKKKNFFNFDE